MPPRVTDAHSLCEYKLRKALGMGAIDPSEHLTWYNEKWRTAPTVMQPTS